MNNLYRFRHHYDVSVVLLVKRAGVQVVDKALPVTSNVHTRHKGPPEVEHAAFP